MCRKSEHSECSGGEVIEAVSRALSRVEFVSRAVSRAGSKAVTRAVSRAVSAHSGKSKLKKKK